MRQCLLAVSTLSLLAAAAPAAAQAPNDAENPLVPGARSLSFSLPSGGGAELGYWRMRSTRTNLGLFLTLRAEYSRAETDDGTTEQDRSGGGFAVGVGPALRHYTGTSEDVAPFLFSSARVQYSYRSSVGGGTEGPVDHGVDLALNLGVGLEWFPTDRVGVSGQTGIGLGTTYQTYDFATQSAEHWSARLRTFTSALTFNIYLPPRAPADPG